MKEKDSILYTTFLTKEQSEELDTVICEKYDIDREEVETATLIRSMIISEVEKVDFSKELDDIIKRIDTLKNGTEFTLADLYSKAEWESKESYKKILGKLFRARAKKTKNITLTDKKKGSSSVYKKIK